MLYYCVESNSQTHRNSKLVVKRGWGEGKNGELFMIVSYTKWINPRDLLYNIAPTVNNLILCTQIKRVNLIIKHPYPTPTKTRAKGHKETFGGGWCLLPWLWWWFHGCMHVQTHQIIYIKCVAFCISIIPQ